MQYSGGTANAFVGQGACDFVHKENSKWRCAKHLVLVPLYAVICAGLKNHKGMNFFRLHMKSHNQLLPALSSCARLTFGPGVSTPSRMYHQAPIEANPPAASSEMESLLRSEHSDGLFLGPYAAF